MTRREDEAHFSDIRRDAFGSGGIFADAQGLGHIDRLHLEERPDGLHIEFTCDVCDKRRHLSLDWPEVKCLQQNTPPDKVLRYLQKAPPNLQQLGSPQAQQAFVNAYNTLIMPIAELAEWRYSDADKAWYPMLPACGDHKGDIHKILLRPDDAERHLVFGRAAGKMPRILEDILDAYAQGYRAGKFGR